MTDQNIHEAGIAGVDDAFLRMDVLAKMHGVTKHTIRRWFRLADQGQDSPLPPRETLSPKVAGCWASALAEHRAARKREAATT